jgi:hypothetical protein
MDSDSPMEREGGPFGRSGGPLSKVYTGALHRYLVRYYQDSQFHPVLGDDGLVNLPSVVLILTGWLLTTTRFSVHRVTLRRIIPLVGVTLITAGVASLI